MLVGELGDVAIIDVCGGASPSEGFYNHEEPTITRPHYGRKINTMPACPTVSR
jgi:hypothetical protein